MTSLIFVIQYLFQGKITMWFKHGLTSLSYLVCGDLFSSNPYFALQLHLEFYLLAERQCSNLDEPREFTVQEVRLASSYS